MDKLISQHRQALILTLLIVVVGILLVLSGSLPDLELERGKYLVPDRTDNPATPAAPDQTPTPPRRLLQSDTLSVLIRIAFWIVLPLAIYVFIFENDRFLKRIVGTMATLVVFLFFARTLAEMDFSQNLVPRTPVPTQPSGTLVAPPDFGGTPSTSLTFLVGFVIALVILIGTLVAWRRIRARLSTEEKIKQRAQEALDELSRGATIENTILRCYQEMARSLAEEEGITRDKSMTPREFEQRLIREGFPEAPVLTLTRLFESVRYGGQTVSAEQEQDAVRSLEAITALGDSDAE